MNTTNHSVKFARQRRFLLVLPLLTLPFITLMFWAFGGGRGSEAMANTGYKGINLKLPDAKLKDDKTLNKLSFYQQAALDSAKTKAAEKLDPYWNSISGDSGFSMSNTGENSMDANRKKVYEKLDALKKVLNNAEQTSNYNQPYREVDNTLKRYSTGKDIDQLQTTMQAMQNDQTEDPEITQLNEMLDKIQAIQNPEKVMPASKQHANKSLTVRKKKVNADVSLLKPDSSLTRLNDTTIQKEVHNAFYSFSNGTAASDSINNSSIECFIPETQVLVAGATIKMTLVNDVTINDVDLPSGTLIYGTASISNERLKVTVSSIRHQNAILPVSLDVYDMDGQEGIFIPGSISRTVAKESTNKAISSMDATMIDPSIGAQAASAGIEAAKTLIGKKVKLIKVTVKSGYKVLLKDSNDK